ncbi:MAG: TetR/AcrR family transcriptional regulator [Alphaproteobacteria bacterium]|jgi:AcrR family transcriptional regulator|nr:TetR/AcrR family transcriptional regulator [Brevundimonas sp.]MBU1272146.1 TetR/AcrR family transcriptional regulator [Alphaproteobacteria bacterium]OHC97570.1 MAG: TetR family transcriptional regulator [Sphingomonadales bacterium RIFCSPHIGHO2_01_FULL_65_20]MBU1521000.1 TetR/AcrR family transcriptional regulator [Alphaproteobacteria bacterium]MBU2031259.1 TetR/AcrR family transcriptional regulator [Alphaproteobacteria bacterium]
MAASPERMGRRTRAEQRAATEKLILDTAEDLFSQRGYFGVTIKDVADAMGIHPALIHYYHAGKQAIFDAVFERRVGYAVTVRTAGLDAYEAQAGDSPTVEGVLRAYYDGAFDVYINGDEGWRAFGRIFAQVNNAPGYGAEKMDFYFDPLVLRLIHLLQKALPDADPRDLFWSFQFTSGAYTLILSRTGRIDRLSDDLCRSDDFEAVRERFVTFMAAGFDALYRTRQARGAAAAE